MNKKKKKRYERGLSNFNFVRSVGEILEGIFVEEIQILLL